jgi:hypothetical protein
MKNFRELVLEVATIALVVFVTRWVITSAGSNLPRKRGDVKVYGIKLPIRVAGVVSAVLFAFITAWFRSALTSPDRPLLALPVFFVILALWISIGSVRTDVKSLKLVSLWRSRTLPWSEITEIRLHPSLGGAIELRTASRKLMIDSRFVALDVLLNDIVEHSKIVPSAANHREQ